MGKPGAFGCPLANRAYYEFPGNSGRIEAAGTGHQPLCGGGGDEALEQFSIALSFRSLSAFSLNALRI
jgi:hypothetical protein